MYKLAIYQKHQKGGYITIHFETYENFMDVNTLERIEDKSLEHLDRIYDQGDMIDIFLLDGQSNESKDAMELPLKRKTSGEILAEWYHTVKADLPWRENRDPYRIWISEIMLQQTQVATVIGYFHRFMKAFPSIDVLAKAEEDDVLALWEGLGYYSRARRIHECAKKVCSLYGGVFPSTYQEIIDLPGIGPYTAGAISSIAFGLPEPAIDGNVYRVISRLYDVEDNISYRKGQKEIEKYVRLEMVEDQPDAFNQGMMELGRIMCKGTSPNCEICPWYYRCKSRRAMTIDERPIKNQKKPPVKMDMSSVVLTFQGKPLVVRRSSEGLLAGLWSFPIVEGNDQVLMDAYGLSVSINEIGQCEHIFSHRHWKVKVYHGEIDVIPDGFDKLMDSGMIKPLPTAFSKVYHEYLKNVK